MNKIEESIKENLKCQQKAYAAFWLVVLLTIVVGECSDSLNGLYANNELVKYVAEVATILIAGLSIPLSLKMVASQVKKIQDTNSAEEILLVYLRWSRVRILLLAISAVLAIATHYLVMSSAGALCAVIVCIVAFLCVPSRKKTRYILSPILSENDQKEE